MGAKEGSITLREMLPLVGMAFAAFIVNTSEFMPVGLLTDIAGSFALTEAEAGMMISIYAWAVMILSVPLMIVASRLEFKRLLLVVLAVFTAGQVASAVAPTFPLLVAARLLVAAAHAIFWAIASPIASRLVPPRHSALALSMVVTGSSLAMIAGMPLGRVIGLAFGWRVTFGCVGAAALAIVIYLAAMVPTLEKGEPFTLGKLPELLHNRGLVALYAVTVLFALGYYTGYSYIEPFFAQVGGLDAGTITAALTLFGIAGLAGSWLFSRFYDGHAKGFLRLMVLGVAAALLLMRFSVALAVGAFAVCALWGLAATAFNVAVQAEVIRCTSTDTSAVAMSIFSGLFNLGIGCGSALGGIVQNVLSLEMIGFVGGAVVLAGLAVCVAALRPAPQQA